ncbi:MAG: hypothetical protein HPY89_07120 [Pelotomaculum sp.]|nr:hypothetical protein [Pelotomaculum sp.]
MFIKAAARFFAIALVAMFCFWGGGPALAQPADIQGHWAEKQIGDWFARGLIAGYGDGTFRPDNKVTRAEFVVMTNRAFGFNSGIQAPFSDVSPGDWFFGQVCAAVAAGYIAGDEDGRFRPGDEISRQEAAVVLSRLLKLKMPEGMDVLAAFKDAGSIARWSRAAVSAVVAAGYMAGYPEDRTFRPAEPITRAEAVVVLDRAKKAYEQSLAAGGTAVPGAGAVSVAVPLADRTMTAGGQVLVIDLAGVFSSAGGASLTYSASSSNAGVAAVAVSGSTLTVSAVGAGSAVITVTAGDGRGNSATGEFTVTVAEAAPGGGGGGGGAAPGGAGTDAPKIESASITVGGQTLPVDVEDGLKGTVDLSGLDGSAVITGGTITVSEASTLTLSVQVGDETVTRSQSLKAGVNTLEAMDIIKKYGLSLNIIELFLGDPVELTGTLEDTGGNAVNVSLTIDLP